MATEKNPVQEVLKQTHTGVGMLDDEKKIHYARANSGFGGFIRSIFRGFGHQSYRTMVDGKNLINQRKKK